MYTSVKCTVRIRSTGSDSHGTHVPNAPSSGGWSVSNRSARGMQSCRCGPGDRYASPQIVAMHAAACDLGVMYSIIAFIKHAQKSVVTSPLKSRMPTRRI